MGITLATLHKLGKIPVLKDKFAISLSLVEKKFIDIFKINIGMLFGPKDLFISKDCIISKISWEVTGDKKKIIIYQDLGHVFLIVFVCSFYIFVNTGANIDKIVIK